jgi:hypothetical protein
VDVQIAENSITLLLDGSIDVKTSKIEVIALNSEEYSPPKL